MNDRSETSTRELYSWVKVKVSLTQSCLTLLQPMNCSCQAPLSMGISRQEYWSGLPFPSPGDLPNPGIKPESPALQADYLPLSFLKYK